MNVAIEDIRGRRFGRLTVESLTISYSGKSRWVCRCSCGQERVCGGADLKASRVKACFDCSRTLKHERLSESGRAPGRNVSDVGRLTAMLDEGGRMKYERWQESCARLGVHVSRNERIEVLRELTDGRKAA